MLTTQDTKVHKETAEFLMFLHVLCGCISSFQSRVCCLLLRLAIMKRVPSGSNSVVECDLAKVEVAGSNPVSRSRKSLYFFDHKGAKAEIFLLFSSASLWFNCLRGPLDGSRMFDEFGPEASTGRIVE